MHQCTAMQRLRRFHVPSCLLQPLKCLAILGLQVVADKCQVHASPCIQVWRDSSLVESVDNPTTTELEDLLQRHGARW